MDSLKNHSPPWASYQELISVHLVVLDEHLGVNTVGLGETCLRLFDKCVLKATVPQADHSCDYYQLCAVFNVGINGAVHRVQYIWDANSTN